MTASPDETPGTHEGALHEAPAFTTRVCLAFAIAGLCAVYTWMQHSYLVAQAAAPDSLFLWRAARLLLAGHDPWDAAIWNHAATVMHETASAPWTLPMRDPLYYPLPAVLLWVPLAVLPFVAASTVFNACGAFAFVLALTRTSLLRAWMAGSIPFMFAMRFGQWSPLICAAAVYPWLSAVLVAKPNIGAAVFGAWPTLRAALACTLVLVLPTIVLPHWIGGWWHNVSSEMGAVTPHPMPITMFHGAGVLLLLAAARWRRAEARLLLLMACVPQLPYWADQLPLMLIARTRREILGSLLVTLCGFAVWMVYAAQAGDFVDSSRPVSVLCTYVPALMIVLRRPNAGPIPAWVERRLVRHLPAFMTGS